MVSSFLIAALFLLPALEDAQGDATVSQAGIARLFADVALLEVTIRAPLTTLMEARPKDEYLEGTFSFTADDGAEQILDLKIRTRGKYRHQKKHCAFAPIRLNLRKKQVVDTIFAGQDKLKLVTHCNSSKPHYEQLVLREYLAYRILQVLTDKSFGVRLLRINYVDTEGGEPMTKLGFVIEDDDDVARRHGMQTVQRKHLSDDDLDHRQQILIDVFQYLIGNTEYSLFNPEPNEHCCHNGHLFSGESGTYLVPYDFDLSGLVNARYAEPDPSLGINRVTRRLYRGYCVSPAALAVALGRIVSLREEILAVPTEIPGLSADETGDAIRFLERFFERAEDRDGLLSRFEARCL